MSEPETPATKPAEPDTAPRPHDRPPAGNEPAGQPATGETGGPRGLEPTRYGDWERNGRCIDF